MTMRPVNRNAAFGISYSQEPLEQERTAPAAFKPSVKHIKAKSNRRRGSRARITDLNELERQEIIQSVLPRITINAPDGSVRRVPNAEQAGIALLERELMKALGMSKIRNFQFYRGYSELKSQLFAALRAYEAVPQANLHTPANKGI
jgi:hypothetical protein